MGRAKIIPPKTLLLPYQAKWVRDASQMKLAVKSRQIGWSWTAAYSIVRRKSLNTARLDAWITSRDELQAKLFVDDCKSFANILQIGAEDLGERVLLDPDGKTASAFMLRMANRSRRTRTPRRASAATASSTKPRFTPTSDSSTASPRRA